MVPEGLMANSEASRSSEEEYFILAISAAEELATAS